MRIPVLLVVLSSLLTSGTALAAETAELLKKFKDWSACRDGESGEKVFSENHFDLCILDVMMPKKDGFTLAKSIRATNQQVPILFITAKSMLEDKINGFQAGGDANVMVMT